MTIKDIVLIALMAAFIIVINLIPALYLPFTAVPITAETLGIMLAGALLGAKRGMCTILIIIIFIAIGLPVLPGGHGGLGVLYGPTAGYIIGWIFSAGVIGGLFHLFRHNLSPLKQIISLILGGIITIYFFGIMWTLITTNASLWSTILRNLIFIPGDLIKIAIIYAILKALHKALPNQFDSDNRE